MLAGGATAGRQRVELRQDELSAEEMQLQGSEEPTLKSVMVSDNPSSDIALHASLIAELGSYEDITSALLKLPNAWTLMLGAEQDFSYVRFVLAAAGYSASPHPQPFSPQLPIPPSFFDILEAFLDTLTDSGGETNRNNDSNNQTGANDELAVSTDEGRSDAARSKSVSTMTSPIPPASHSSDEQRQRRLLFDASNEALGRCLSPALTCSDSPMDDGIMTRMEGKGLMKAVWVEVCSWPVPPFSSVCDVLDEAARRDVVRGADRWQQDASSGMLESMVILELEEHILREVMEELCEDIATTCCTNNITSDCSESDTVTEVEIRRADNLFTLFRGR